MDWQNLTGSLLSQWMQLTASWAMPLRAQWPRRFGRSQLHGLEGDGAGALGRAGRSQARHLAHAQRAAPKRRAGLVPGRCVQQRAEARLCRAVGECEDRDGCLEKRVASRRPHL